jgi:hypothetical protein
MMTTSFEVGKLYKCSNWHLLVWPSVELAEKMSRTKPMGWAPHDPPAATARYWAHELDCTMWFSWPNEVFMALGNKGQCYHVLFGEFKGWINNKAQLEIERVL